MAHPQKKLTSNNEFLADRNGRHRLDELDPARIAAQLMMFEPSEEVIADLVARARLSIPGIATASEAIKVQRHNPACIMALARKSKFDPAAPAGEGFIAMLPLNKRRHGASRAGRPGSHQAERQVSFQAR